MKGFRSPILGALLALSCLPAVGYHRLADEVESILDNALSYVPDLPRSETMDLLLADVNAGALVGTRRAEHEARRVADDVIAWANGGRRPILLRDEQIAGEWRARIAFLGPGNYRAESYRNASTPGERGEVIVREAATRADAWRVAGEEAKTRANAESRARLFSPYPDDAAPSRLDLAAEPMTFDLAIKAGRQWLAECDPDAAGIILHLGTGPETVTTDPRFLAGRAAGEIEHRGGRNWFFARALVLREPGVIKSINLRIKVGGDGVTVDGAPPGDTLTVADVRRAVAEIKKNAIGPDPDGFYRIPRFDDPGIQERLAEREVIGRAFNSAMSDGMTGRDRGMSPQDYRREAIEGIAADRAVIGIDLAAPGGDRTIVTRETDFQRANRLAMNTPADRAFASVRKPPPPKPAYSPPPPPRPDWPPRYSAKPKPAKPPIDPEVKAEWRSDQRIRKAGRTAARKRRGWS